MYAVMRLFYGEIFYLIFVISQVKAYCYVFAYRFVFVYVSLLADMGRYLHYLE